MNLFSLMRLFTIRFRMLGAIGVVLGLLGLLKMHAPRRRTINTAGLMGFERQDGARTRGINHAHSAIFLGHDVNHIARFAGASVGGCLCHAG